MSDRDLTEPTPSESADRASGSPLCADDHVEALRKTPSAADQGDTEPEEAVPEKAIHAPAVDTCAGGTDDLDDDPEDESLDEDDLEDASMGWWASAWDELRQVRRPPGKEAWVLGASVLGTLIALGSGIALVDLGFSKLSLEVYGRNSSLGHPLAATILSVVTVVVGLVATAGILSQKAKGAGLSTFANLNSSRLAEGPSARRLAIGTYVAIGVFLVLAVLVNLVLT